MWRTGSSSSTRLQIRVVFYILVILALFLFRGHADWSRWLDATLRPTVPDSTLRVAGSDLAPHLAARLIEHYREEYPAVAPSLQPGGTHHALEALLEGRAEAGLLTRPPSPAEQELCREVRGDTLLSFPAAVGGIVLLSNATSPPETLDTGTLRNVLNPPEGSWSPRIYAPDPNLGIWAAFLEAVGADPDSIGARVVFLADAAAVMGAVEAEAGALGVFSTLSLPPGFPGSGGSVVAMRASEGSGGARPELESIISGEYPLFHRLYLAVPGEGSREAGKFVTFVVSAHGQRVVQRTGCVPARYVLREVRLSSPRAGGSK